MARNEPAAQPPSDETGDDTGNPNDDIDHPQGGSPGHQPPSLPTEEELAAQVPLEAPAAVDATAVDTVATSEGDKKYGWQNEPVKPELLKEPCFHTGIVQARKQVPAFDVGHEWVCICGTIFVVHVNKGGKKTLVEKESLAPPLTDPLPEEPVVEEPVVTP